MLDDRGSSMTMFRLTNAIVFDGHEVRDGVDVVVENDHIVEVGPGSIGASDAAVVNCEGGFLMPGLIDAHFHAYSPTFDIPAADRMPPSLLASHAAKVLRGALHRGFTTVRDAGGGERGLQMAIDEGLIEGPRFHFAGKALSQTGGHGDSRPGNEIDLCGCQAASGSISRVVDGIDAMRLAVRDELRRGASQIKIFVSGGVLSPTDPMWMPQFTDDEIRAAVYEAGTRRKYVMAHCHTDEGARRCVTLGVRSIEHGSLIHRDDTAQLIAEHGAYVVPTLSVAEILKKHASELGIPAMGVIKIREAIDQMFASIETCRRNGVKLGLGTDLLDHRYHPAQGGEFELRGRVDDPIEVLRSATSVNAEIMQMTGEIGCIAPGAFADLLLVAGDPLKDLTLFKSIGDLPFLMKAGQVVRNTL